MLTWIINNLGHILTSATIVVAFATWYSTQRKAAKSEIISYTTSLLSQTKTVSHMAEADFLVNSMINKKEKINHESISLETEKAIFLMLNYYEYLCSLVELGVIDRNTLLHLRGGLMKRTYLLCGPYIIQYRKVQNRDEIYRKLQTFSEAVDY